MVVIHYDPEVFFTTNSLHKSFALWLSLQALQYDLKLISAMWEVTTMVSVKFDHAKITIQFQYLFDKSLND